MSDATLPDTTVVYRFLAPKLSEWDVDGNCSVQSHSYREIGAETATRLGYVEPAMSIAFHDEVMAAGKTVEEVRDIEAGEDYGIARLTVGEIRSVLPELGVLKDGGATNPWHGIVFALTRKKMKAEKGHLRDLAEVILEPKQPPDYV